MSFFSLDSKIFLLFIYSRKSIDLQILTRRNRFFMYGPVTGASWRLVSLSPLKHFIKCIHNTFT